jgi:TfoX/Sxy family transcriptional regulator of competence genes
MPHDPALADRVRQVVGDHPGVTEKAMFGGVAFLLDGKMFCGVASDDLMVRVGPDRHEEALARPHARPMDFTGRPMKGYVFVAPAGCRTAKAIKPWADWAMSFVATLGPAKHRPRKRALPAPARSRARPGRRSRPTPS